MARSTVEFDSRLGRKVRWYGWHRMLKQSDNSPGKLAAAQVHAILALAAATVLDSDRREWLDVAGGKLSD
jgi:hypothetical protein